MIYSFGTIAVEFNCENVCLENLVKEEYRLLPETDRKPDFTIIIGTKDYKYSCPQKVLHATGRESIVYFTGENEIYVKVPRNNLCGQLFCMVNPTYLSRQEAALMDFLHNYFLCILQLFLLDCNCSLFHACCFSLEKKEEGFVLLGGAQSGKSTLLGCITDNYNGNIVSEDFGIISLDNYMYALPHKSRIFFDQYKLLKHDISVKEKFNIFICKMFKRQILRILPLDQIFLKHKFCNKCFVKHVYVLMRDGDTVYTEKITKQEFVNRGYSILQNEFENFTGFTDIYDLLQEYKPKMLNSDCILDNTRSFLTQLYDNCLCEIIHVPYENTPEKAAAELKRFLLRKYEVK